VGDIGLYDPQVPKNLQDKKIGTTSYTFLQLSLNLLFR
jgi:hypothetical protein